MVARAAAFLPLVCSRRFIVYAGFLVEHEEDTLHVLPSVTRKPELLCRSHCVSSRLHMDR